MAGRTTPRRETPRHQGGGGSDSLVAAFAVRWLVRLYAEFDGDILAAVVLGELALRDGVLPAAQPGPGIGLHANAFAIAHATGIPRETVRRKLTSLERRGWIRRAGKGSFAVTPRAREHFASCRAELREQLLELATVSRPAGRRGLSRSPASP